MAKHVDPIRNFQTLMRCGIALFGLAWKSAASRALGVNVSTVNRWESTEAAFIGDDNWKILRARLRERERECAVLVALITEAVPDD